MGELGGGEPLRVLIAEDEPGIAELYEEVVCTVVPRAGVVWVISEEGAVEAGSRSCGLILMDGSLKPGSGVSAIRRIRAAGIQTPVVFVSGEPDLVEAAQGEPRVIALSKPVKVAELRDAIRQAIRDDERPSEPQSAGRK